MAIKTYSASDFRSIKVTISSPRCKYPWRQTEVDGAFFVPEQDAPRGGSGPVIPESVRREMTYKKVRGNCPETNKPGWWLIRFA